MPRTSSSAVADAGSPQTKRQRKHATTSAAMPTNYPEQKIAALKESVRTILTCLGEDVEREGLQDTPKRVAKAWMDVSIGYRQDPVSMLGVTSDRPGGAFFSDDTVAQGSNGIVVVRDIDFASTNLSTLLPFHGRAHIGYVPSAGVVLGLSKLARLTKHFGKKLQSQAKLATDIASCLQTHLQCQGIAVYIEARQITPLCVEASRREACIGGCFAEDPAQFQEFLALLNMSAPSSSNIHYLPSSKPSSSDSTQLLMTPTALSEDDSIEATNGSADSSRSQGVMLRSESYASDLASSAEAKSNPNMAKMEQAINRMILEIEEDPFSTNLSKSASRYALGLLESTQGYTAPLPTRKDALVPASQSDLTVDSVTLSGAEGATTVVTASFIFNSQCEHHMLPFYGQTMVAYVPPAGSSPRLLSRSALEQVVRVYTRRLQVQERITHQLADAVADLAMPDGVMVVCQAAHMCMLARGVENHSGATSTFAVRGAFEKSPELRRHVLLAFNQAAATAK